VATIQGPIARLRDAVRLGREAFREAFNPSAVARERRALLPVKQLEKAASPPADTLPRTIGLFDWTASMVRAARQSQARGDYKTPAEIFRSARTDAAVFAALLNRVAPQMVLPLEVVKGPAYGHASRGLADRVCDEARELFLGDSPALSPAVRAEINECLAVHGEAFAQNVWSFNEETGRVDVRLESWPIEFVKHFEIGPDGGRGRYALTFEGQWIPIVHGDGQWVHFSARELQPWYSGALMPLCGLWDDRAWAIRYRAMNAESHGDSKWIATLPQGVKTTSDQGTALLSQVQRLNNFQRSLLKPFGSEVKREEATGLGWQIFREIINEDNADIFSIFIGQAQRGDSSQRLSKEQLFGVAQDVVEGDTNVMARGFNTGTIRPWQAKNFGRVDLVKGIAYLIPKPEQDARRDSIAKRWGSFNEIVSKSRSNGIDITDEFVGGLMSSLGLEGATLGAGAAGYTEIDVKYGLVTINEARAANKLAPIDGGDVTVPQSATVAKVATSPAIQAGTPPATGGGQPSPTAPANGVAH
jgi:hypothetical protein